MGGCPLVLWTTVPYEDTTGDQFSEGLGDDMFGQFACNCNGSSLSNHFWKLPINYIKVITDFGTKSEYRLFLYTDDILAILDKYSTSCLILYGLHKF